jgi:ABC-type multidrug transport system ATPase subunit
MKRRLSLARLLLRRPRVLLMDEPFSSLDQRARKWLDQYLQSFTAGGGAVLMATHAFGQELELTERLLVLASGRIVLDTPREALGADEVQRLYALHTEDRA